MSETANKLNKLPIRQRQEYKSLAIRLGSAMARVAKITATFPNTYTYQAEAEALEEASFVAYKLMKLLKQEYEDKSIVIVEGE